MFRYLTALLAVAALAAPARAAMFASPEAQADMITDLPGLSDDIAFEQYSGYLNLPGTEKQIHYWFVTAETDDPMSAPLAFWTNGGPGCSGLLGFMEEQGPFRPQADGSLMLNDYRWNLVANMVFIEIPVGVGFSYSTQDGDTRIGDDQTAEDNYYVIQTFLDRFSELRSTDLYITSESYGGHYMPTLANKIVEKNADSSNTHLNFKGFAVGNPYTDAVSNSYYMYEKYQSSSLLFQATWDEYDSTCNRVTSNIKPSKVVAEKCLALATEISLQISQYVNPYALDYPVCLDDVVGAGLSHQRHQFLNFILDDHIKPAMDISPTYEPCTDDYTNTYLNRADVQAAIHVHSDVEWAACAPYRQVPYEYRDKRQPMMDYYNTLLDASNDLKILVYSGDDDSVCATAGTQWWIYNLGYDVTTNWDTWTVEGQLGGYMSLFDVPHTNQFAFYTVHGAGHEVPTYKPEAALQLFTAYLTGDVFSA